MTNITKLSKKYGIARRTIQKLKETYTKETDLVAKLEELKEQKDKSVADVERAKAIKVNTPRKFIGKTKEDLQNMLQSYILEEQRNKKVLQRLPKKRALRSLHANSALLLKLKNVTKSVIVLF